MTGRSAIGLSLSGLLWLWAAGSAATGGPEPLGQANIVAQAKDAAKQLPAFEVAAIKPNKTGGGGSHSSFDGIRLTATNISVKSLIQYDAYAIPGPQILGGPNWLASDRFDIEAKVDDAVVAEMAKLDREQRNQVERELEEELRYHIEQRVGEEIAKGVAPEEARYIAVRSMGGIEQRKEECRDMRGWNLMDNLMQDLRFTLRQLKKNPGFTSTAILMLALGICASVAIFAFVDAALLKPLPYRNPSTLLSTSSAMHLHCGRSISPSI